MNWEKQLTTAGTANTAEKQVLMWVCPINHWVGLRNSMKFKLFAVPAVFAVVELRV